MKKIENKPNRKIEKRENIEKTNYKNLPEQIKNIEGDKDINNIASKYLTSLLSLGNHIENDTETKKIPASLFDLKETRTTLKNTIYEKYQQRRRIKMLGAVDSLVNQLNSIKEIENAIIKTTNIENKWENQINLNSVFEISTYELRYNEEIRSNLSNTYTDEIIANKPTSSEGKDKIDE